tara:strand:+ start:176 stop:421 length:246 start_codon:yes stop_codon:yes gene_type:complete
VVEGLEDLNLLVDQEQEALAAVVEKVDAETQEIHLQQIQHKVMTEEIQLMLQEQAEVEQVPQDQMHLYRQVQTEEQVFQVQ